MKDFNENEILKMVKWCADNNFKQTFIEVMPVGKLDLQRSNQFLPVSFAKEKIKKSLVLTQFLKQMVLQDTTKQINSII